jgi:DNA-nicking Smr family endonuclease
MAKNCKPKPPRSRPGVPDHHLWTRVTETIEPIAKTRFADLVADELANCVPLPAPPRRPKKQTLPPAVPARSTMPFYKTPPPAPPPPIGSLDRRTRQKLTRGNVDIEARLDLHGHSAEIARGELRGFLTAARASGKRTVLVITGKGCSPFARHTLHGAEYFDTPERLGRLRRLLPEWLGETEFRVMVSGFQPAHPRHGGGGAFYIRLRRTGHK